MDPPLSASATRSTGLVRVVAGIWPYGSGEISLPKNKNIMYLPQKPYMPVGTLEEALLFPDDIGYLSEEKLIQLLHDVHLPELVDQLNRATMWSEHLSSGELQRVAFIRVLIHKPDWVFLDETTSALDIESEKFMYNLLKARLPHCSIISVGHRPSLDAYHTHQIDLSTYSMHREAVVE